MKKTTFVVAGTALVLWAGAAVAQDRSGANQAIQNSVGTHASADDTLKYNLAVDDFNGGKLGDATSELKEYLKDVPSDAAAHRLMASIYLKQQRVADAIPEMEAVVKLDTKDQDTRDNLGIAYLQAQQYDKAVPFYKADYVHKPKDADAAFYYGLALAQSGQADQAVPVLRQAIAIRPTARTYAQLGNALNKLGKTADAAAAFQSAVDLDPKDAQLALYAGLLHHTSGDDAAAIPDLKKALTLGTDSAFGAHMALAEAYTKAKQPGDAISEYRLATQARPVDFMAAVNLAISEDNAGRKADAQADYRKAVAISGVDPKPLAAARSNLALLLLNDGKTDEAVGLFTQAAQGDPTDAHFQNNLGIAYEKQGKPDLAVAAYKRAVDLDPNFADAKTALARLSK